MDTVYGRHLTVQGGHIALQQSAAPQLSQIDVGDIDLTINEGSVIDIQLSDSDPDGSNA